MGSPNFCQFIQRVGGEGGCGEEETQNYTHPAQKTNQAASFKHKQPDGSKLRIKVEQLRQCFPAEDKWSHGRLFMERQGKKCGGQR